jgi:hypothetical protein
MLSFAGTSAGSVRQHQQDLLGLRERPGHSGKRANRQSARLHLLQFATGSVSELRPETAVAHAQQAVADAVPTEGHSNANPAPGHPNANEAQGLTHADPTEAIPNTGNN